VAVTSSFLLFSLFCGLFEPKLLTKMFDVNKKIY
jgi:hypothetical protein